MRCHLLLLWINSTQESKVFYVKIWRVRRLWYKRDTVLITSALSYYVRVFRWSLNRCIVVNHDNCKILWSGTLRANCRNNLAYRKQLVHTPRTEKFFNSRVPTGILLKLRCAGTLSVNSQSTTVPSNLHVTSPSNRGIANEYKNITFGMFLFRLSNQNGVSFTIWQVKRACYRTHIKPLIVA